MFLVPKINEALGPFLCFEYDALLSSLCREHSEPAVVYFVLHEQTAPVLLGVGVNKSFQLHAVTLAIILKLKEILFKVCSVWIYLICLFLFITL